MCCKTCNSYFHMVIATCCFCMKVVTEDMDANGDLEAIIQEVGGRVICYNLPNGRLLWQKQLTGEVPLSMRVIDLENDLHPELLVTTDDGLVFDVEYTCVLSINCVIVTVK
jgi:hypothetical protein